MVIDTDIEKKLKEHRENKKAETEKTVDSADLDKLKTLQADMDNLVVAFGQLAIQEKAIRSVGAAKEDPIDVRVLSATHKDLEEQIEAGKFRQDLFYRLNVIQLNVPALRDRKDDIATLASHFLAKLAKETDSPQPELASDALADLVSYYFPGNVRELENILERAFTLCDSNIIKSDDLQLKSTSQSSSIADNTQSNSLGRCLEYSSLDEYLAEIEKDILLQALEKVRWNKTLAAKELGITFRSLRYRLQKLGLESD